MMVKVIFPNGKQVAFTSNRLKSSGVGGFASENAQTLNKFMNDIYVKYSAALAGFKE